MRTFRSFLCLFCLSLISLSGFCQKRLTSGFDPNEYLQLLQLFNAQTADLYPPDTVHAPIIPSPVDYKRVYQSPEVGLFNRWSLWLDTDSTIGVISIRSTIMKPESWMENFFAAMVPATGSMKINDSTTFSYKLAQNPEASVHAGWLLGLASLAPTILKEIKRYDRLGVKQFIVFGHSQGGAIAFLLRSYLQYLPDTMLPKDIVFKTYCSAAPKPGNLYYSYTLHQYAKQIR